MSDLDTRMQALGAGAVVDVSKVAAPASVGGVGATREPTPSEIARSKREAGF
jgi:hypothetical protein